MNKFAKIRSKIPQTDEYISRLCGVSTRTIRRWVKGDSTPKESVYAALKNEMR